MYDGDLGKKTEARLRWGGHVKENDKKVCGEENAGNGATCLEEKRKAKG